jgi:hypothetical protein
VQVIVARSNSRQRQGPRDPQLRLLTPARASVKLQTDRAASNCLVVVCPLSRAGLHCTDLLLPVQLACTTNSHCHTSKAPSFGCQAMSVSVEQPLHFSQQPSSPSFSSPPHSPAQLLHAQTPASPAPPPPADVDMSASVTTLPPAGQQHDRQDANMEDGLGLTNTRGEEARGLSNTSDTVNDTVAVEVAAVDADAMDTTPDTNTGLVLPNGSSGPLEAAVTPISPPANEALAPESSTDQTAPTIPSGDEVSRTDGLG